MYALNGGQYQVTNVTVVGILVLTVDPSGHKNIRVRFVDGACRVPIYVHLHKQPPRAGRYHYSSLQPRSILFVLIHVGMRYDNRRM